ncbi:molecular chaperone [Enterobacter cloacae]|uniref:molecular chaperone n=1 Tax=Enterobacter cloacae TaxID=550 RepID=UPI0034A0F016
MKLTSKLLLAGSLLATMTAANAGVIVGATRVIYHGENREETLSVKNPEKETVYMIQSWVEKAAAQNNTPFIVTPQLFPLAAGKETNLRITKISNDLPKDRESVYWLDVKSTPGSVKPEENELQVSIKSRLKLIYRPAGLQGNPADAYKQLTFSRQGNQLQVTNPTPYFVSFYSVKVGAKEINNTGMVAPKSTLNLPLPEGAASTVKWQSITDFGDISKPAESHI